jgi:YegS/Rv2252/BmrU family lipid kinase
MEPLLLVRNKKSGLVAREEEIEKGIAYLKENGFETITVFVEDVCKKEDFTKTFEKYKPATIIAAGGDGTVNMLANHLAGTNVRLAVIPAGTFNHFAKHIGIGTDIVAAFTNVINGETITIDTAEVNGRTFVNFSCVGFYTELIKKRIFYQKKLWKKWPAFVISLFEGLVNHASLNLTIRKNDAEVDVRTPLIFVGNNIFDFGGLDVLSGRQAFTSGKLHISVAKDMGRWGIFILSVRAFFSDIKNRLGFTTVALDEIEINSPRSYMWVSLDGEVAKIKTPLHYKICPQSLRVIVPKNQTS